MGEYRLSKGIWISLCSLFLLLAPNLAEAFTVINHHTANALTYCLDSKLYSMHSTAAPSIIANSFAGDGKQVAFRTCQDGDGNTHYFIRKPRPNRNGVCRVFEDEVFPGTDADEVFVEVLYDGTASNWYFKLKGWKAWPPDDWTMLHYTRQSSVLGFVGNENCPLGDDARYIWLRNVTDGMLKSFQNAWGAASRSPKALDKVFAVVPTISSFRGTVDPQPSQRLRDNLRRSVFERHDKVVEISCNESGCIANLSGQAIGFDVTAGGIVFTNLRVLFQA